MNVQPAAQLGSVSRPEIDARPAVSRVRDGVTATTSAPVQETQTETAAQPVSKSQVEEAIKQIRDFVSMSGKEINFSVDDVSGVRVVKVMDKATNEVIRQIPSEEVVAIARALDKLQGLFVSDKV